MDNFFQRTLSRLKAILLMCTLPAVSAQAFELEGYYKNLLIHSETILGNDTSYWLDINRLRLDFTQDFANVEMSLVYDHELQLGTYLDTQQFRLSAEASDPFYWDLQGNSLDRGDAYATHGLYRGTIKVQGEHMDLRVGRQQINWATAAIWNPMDRFNPLNPLQLERDERQGVDAALLDINLDNLSRLSIAYAPQHRGSNSSAAVRYKSNVGLWDWSVMAGEFADVQKQGLSFAGQIGLIGVRSEWVHSEPEVGKPYSEWSLGADYTTHSGITFMLERYFNGEGTSTPAQYDFNAVIDGKMLGAGRHYLGGRVAKDVSSLLTVELYAIRNLDDHSYFIFPSLSYAMPGFKDLYLGAGAQLFVGDNADEYAFFKNLYSAEVKIYF